MTKTIACRLKYYQHTKRYYQRRYAQYTKIPPLIADKSKDVTMEPKNEPPRGKLEPEVRRGIKPDFRISRVFLFANTIRN
jgi:hypothetical protein